MLRGRNDIYSQRNQGNTDDKICTKESKYTAQEKYPLWPCSGAKNN